MTLLDRLVVRSLPLVPRPIVGRVAARYIAGPTLADAVRVVRTLNAEGALATLDILGEDIFERPAAEAGARGYLDVLDAIQRERLDGNISIKLSALGLRFDRALCAALMREVIAAVRAHGGFARIDMEDASVTDATLELYRALHAEYGCVGVVLQACLRRTRADAAVLLRDGLANIRLCKGIYRESAEIAFQEFEEIRRSYVETLELVLRGGGYVGIATHDEYLAREGERIVRELGLTRAQYEFQMLLGVAPELRRRLIGAGHRVRVYVPFGERWYAYSTRRLKENPRIAGYVFTAMVPRLFRPRPPAE